MDVASTVLLADMWGWNGHMGGGWWIVMMGGMVLFWVVLVVGIVWLVRGPWTGGTTWQQERAATPLEILDRRFAAGDLSADEYHERRKVLTGSGGPTGPREPVGP
jgi:putative membrane protein